MRTARRVVGLAVLGLACAYLAKIVDGAVLTRVLRAIAADPFGLLLALACYAVAFDLRARAWRRVLPGIGHAHSWAALHVSLLGNHVLPFRLGEALRVTSVLRRTELTAGPVTATALTIRVADLLGVLLLALVAVPGLLLDVAGRWVWVLAGLLVVLGAASLWWLRRLEHRRLAGGSAEPVIRVRMPGAFVLTAGLLAWVLESTVVWEIARTVGAPLGLAEAVAVTAVTIAAQTVAVTPGGIGSYEAAATAALVALGVPRRSGLRDRARDTRREDRVLAGGRRRRAVRAGTDLLGAAAGSPANSRHGPPRWPVDAGRAGGRDHPGPRRAGHGGETWSGRLPHEVAGRPLVCVVVDDGSTDASARDLAAAAGARVVAPSTQPRSRCSGPARPRRSRRAEARGRGLPRRRRRVPA